MISFALLLHRPHAFFNLKWFSFHFHRIHLIHRRHKVIYLFILLYTSRTRPCYIIHTFHIEWIEENIWYNGGQNIAQFFSTQKDLICSAAGQNLRGMHRDFLHCAFSPNIACICLIFQLSFSISYCSVIFLLIYPAFVWWFPLQGEDWGTVLSDEQPRDSKRDWGEFWNFNDVDVKDDDEEY